METKEKTLTEKLSNTSIHYISLSTKRAFFSVGEKEGSSNSSTSPAVWAQPSKF